MGEFTRRRVTDEERRDFLKALGVSGAVAAGSATLDDVRGALGDQTSTGELTPIGETIRTDLSGELDAELLASEQIAFTEAVSALPGVANGLPTEGPREEFQRIAEAGRPVYTHLAEVGFFESTTAHLPELAPEYLAKSAKAFVGSSTLAAPLTDLDLSGAESVDLVATVISNAQQLSEYHWIATDKIPRGEIEYGEHIPPMTRAAAGGVLLWLEDLDRHLWANKQLITREIHADATWHARSMAAGFQLMIEGANVIAEGTNSLSDGELAALLSTGFAIQTISQNLLPLDAYWISEEMRASRRTDLETINTITGGSSQ